LHANQQFKEQMRSLVFGPVLEVEAMVEEVNQGADPTSSDSSQPNSDMHCFRSLPFANMSTLSKDECVHSLSFIDIIFKCYGFPSITIAIRAAESFTQLYYKTYDSTTRAQDLPNFYRETSAVSWNGRPFQGATGVKTLMESMPKTKHEVQSYDCHPIPSKLSHLRS
jgi:hypothetical protein